MATKVKNGRPARPAETDHASRRASPRLDFRPAPARGGRLPPGRPPAEGAAAGGAAAERTPVAGPNGVPKQAESPAGRPARGRARSGEEVDALRRTEAELRRDLAVRDEQLRVLALRVEMLEAREADLRVMLLAAHKRLTDTAATAGVSAAAATTGAATATAPSPSNAHSGAAAIPLPPGPAAYREVVGRIRRFVSRVALPGSVVLVVSKGDEELTKLDRVQGWHFPRTDAGAYAGHHPADSGGAIEHLESLRARGARYLVFPVTAVWWLEYYDELRQYLDARYRRVPGGDGACVMYKLFGGAADAAPR